MKYVVLCLPFLVAGGCEITNEAPSCEHRMGPLKLLYGHNPTARTASFCIESENDNWMAFGPGRGMNLGTHAVVSHTDVELFDIKQRSKPTNKITFADFGLTQVVMEKRKLCFTMPYAKLEPPHSIASANFAWAVGKSLAFGGHEHQGTLLDFNLAPDSTDASHSTDTTDGTDTGAMSNAIVAHIVCMMLAFLLLFPLGAMIGAYAGPEFDTRPDLLTAHLVTLGCAFALTAGGALAAFAASALDRAHGYVGIALVVLCALLYASSIVRPTDRASLHTWKLVHRWASRVWLACGFAQCIGGAVVLNKHLAIVLGAVVVFAGCTVVTLVSLKFRRKAKDQALPREAGKVQLREKPKEAGKVQLREKPKEAGKVQLWEKLKERELPKGSYAVE